MTRRFGGSLAFTRPAFPVLRQSIGEKVTQCYWEVSDAQGNIVANNFISVAPKFRITIPATASGFTARNCSFVWVAP
ncbi:hypothetical protein [Tersicoccus phoenicis]|uniref:hypothetical protein n=1 Tax=Tersicoccus phoenicis TaxID=554083 RepID=UPI00117D9B04|nr:hypothetical protein [Tersicoccus phoenicis]